MADRALNLSRDSFSFDLIHADSDVYPTGGGAWLGTNPMLFGPPPVLYDEQIYVASPGSIITPKVHRPRDIVIPVTIRVNDTDDVEDVLDTIIRGVDPMYSSTPVRITYTRPDATSRYIDCYQLSGASGIRMFEKTSRVLKFALGFRAPDPYWTDSSGGTVTVTVFTSRADDWDDAAIEWDDAAIGWGFPAYRDCTAFNISGDMRVYPVWEIDGPGDVIVVQDLATEKWFRVDGLATGETMTIDTRPASRDISIDGAPAWDRLVAGSELWTFAPGASAQYRVWIDGNATASEVRMTWAPAWLQC